MAGDRTRWMRQAAWTGVIAVGGWLACPAPSLWAADKTPPTTPVVTDDGAYTTATTQLHATWTSQDPESGIAESQYQLRQETPTGPIVVDWTSVGTATGVTRTGLSLLQGKPYFVAVKARNGANLWSAIGSSDGIKVDTTPPSAVTVTDDGAYTTSTTQLHATWTVSSDPGSGIAGYQYQLRQDATSGTIIRAWTSVGVVTQVTATGLTLTNGKAYYVGVRATNGAGLASSAGFSNGITVDTTPPTGTVTINSGAASTSATAVTLTLSAADNSGTVSQMRFSNDNVTYSAPEVYATTKAWTMSSGEGTKTVSAQFQDPAGNWSAAASDTIILDTTPPTTPTVTDDGNDTNSLTQLHATWTASSDPDSGISNYQYQIRQDSTGGTIIRAWTSVGVATQVTATGLTLTNGKAYYLGVRATNGAGLSSSPGFSNGITVDTTPPTGTVTINSGAASTSATAVTLTLSAADNSGTVSQMQFSSDSVTYSTPEAYATTKPWTLPSGDGLKTVSAKFQDPAGNWSAAVSDTIVLDTAPPTGTMSINNGAAYALTAAVTLSLSATDNSGTISQMQLSNDNVTYTAAEPYASTRTWTLPSGDGVKTVYVTFSDPSNNWSAPASNAITLDTTPPISQITSPADGAILGAP